MRHYLIAIPMLFLLSCGSHDHQKAETLVVENSDFIASDTITEELIVERPEYRATETIETDLIHTKLEVSPDWSKAQLRGRATITAKPHFYASDVLILDAKGMDIVSVSRDGQKLNYWYENDVLTIKLGKTFTRTENYTVVIDYVAKPNDRKTGGSAAISSDKGLYFINPTGEEPGKMPQIWTQGETEASSVWFPTIDAPNVKTSQEIFITVDDKYVTLSNGKLISSKKSVDGKRTDHWKQELPHAPYLFMMAIGEFKVVEDFYTRADGTKIPVNYYVEPAWESSAKAIFGETPQMIRYFSKLLGVEYPWDKYHQIVVRDYVSGAMENTGAVIFGDFVYKTPRELIDENDQSIIAHELFHHWFGDLVTCESWSNLPLNESFANYSQYLWDEHRHGKDEADYQAEREADGYFQSASMQGHHNLIWFDYDDKEQMFDGHSYNKGGRILHMLRNHLGDDAFFAGINLYLTQNKFKPAEFHHLRLAFEEVSGQDLNWFFNQWFLGSGHPTLNFSYELIPASNEIEIIITQDQDLSTFPLYYLPFEIATFDDEGKTIRQVVVDEQKEIIRFPIKGELKGIIYDYEQMLLAKKIDQKSPQKFIHQYYNGGHYLARKEGLLEGSKDKSEAGQQLILDALKDPFWNIRVLAIGKIFKLRDTYKTTGTAILKEIASSDPSSEVRVAALNNLGKLLENGELTQLYQDRIAIDSSYAVISISLKSLGKHDPINAMALAKGLEDEKSSKMVMGIAQLYASYGGAEKYDYITSALTGNIVQGFDKLALLNSFTVYLTQQSDTLAEDAFPIYEELANSGGFYISMFLPQNLTYLTEHIGKQIILNKEELEKQEKANDALYAQKTREAIKRLELLNTKYNQLIAALSTDSENH